jgi:3-hydroxyacyl-[acyl-carrier-protein] dehydratase
MAVELLSHQLEKKLNIHTIKNAKFLSVISPDETPEVGYSIQGVKEADGMVEAKVTVASGEKTFAKISLICKTA